MRLSQKTKISTPAFEQTRDWYQRLFSMKSIEAWDEPGDRGVILALEGGANEALLEIYHCETAHDFSGLSLQYRVEALDDFTKSLPADIPRDGPKARPWGAHYLYLTDPNGIPVIVYEGCW